MASYSISIGFRLDHYRDKLSPLEDHPQVHVYFDNRWERRPTIIQLWDSRDTSVGHVVEAKTRRNTLDPSRCYIGLASFAWRNNDEFGYPELLDAGTNHVVVGDLLREIQDRGVFTHDLPLTIHTARNLQKGTIRMTVRAADVQVDSRIRWEIPPYAPSGRVGGNLGGSPIRAYIEATLEISQQMPDTVPGTEKMRVPFDMSESGMELTGGAPIPAIGFVLSEIPETNITYWQNALRTVMDRENLRLPEWQHLPIESKAVFTVLAICYKTHYMDYVSDTVATPAGRLEPTENFGALDDGDCEDGGAHIHDAHNALLTLRINPQSDPQVYEAQQIAHQYLPPLSLDAVHGAQATDGQEARLGAHMNDNYIPIATFQRWLGQTKEGRAVLAKLPWDSPNSGGFRKDLPFLVAEGTGMYQPLGEDHLERLPLMGYVYGNAPSLAGFKKPIAHRRGETGPFFVASLEGMTDYFIRRGSNVGGFWYTSDGGASRGALYEDMMRDSPRVGIIMQPPLAPAVLDTVQDAISIRVPPRPLTLDDPHRSVPPSRQLDALCAEVAGWKRKPGHPLDYVHIYLRPHQIDGQICRRIAADFYRMDRIWKVSYKPEIVTNDMFGYRMKVWVSK